MLASFTTTQIFGVPVLAVFAVGLAVIMSVVLNRTIYGRSVLGIGQNMRAAWLSGIKVERIRFATYVLSAVLASLCGVMLAGFSGGAALNMGEEYLLASIAVVVIGGTSVAGGKANIAGIWGAALFLFLLVTMLNTFGASAGIRLIMTGLIIVAVITIAGGDEPK
jgi:ribose transport system permease protein